MDSVTGTVYSLSGVASATNAEGQVRQLNVGDPLHADDAITCAPCSGVVIVDAHSGAIRMVGAGAESVPAEKLLPTDSTDLQLHLDTAILDPSQLRSEAVQTNLYLAAGRSAGILKQLLAEGLEGQQRVTGLDELPVNQGNSLIDALESALEQALESVSATDLFFQSSGSDSPLVTNAAEQLVASRQQLESFRSGLRDGSEMDVTQADALNQMLSRTFEAIELSESAVLDAYSREVPGGPAWFGNGSPMRFDLGQSQSLQIEPRDADATVQQGVETLEISAVLSSVTEHQLEDVLSFDRDGSQLKVSVQGAQASHEHSEAILLDAQFAASEPAPWDLGGHPGGTGPDSGQG